MVTIIGGRPMRATPAPFIKPAAAPRPMDMSRVPMK
jgi:hypothetical protein